MCLLLLFQACFVSLFVNKGICVPFVDYDTHLETDLYVAHGHSMLRPVSVMKWQVILLYCRTFSRQRSCGNEL